MGEFQKPVAIAGMFYVAQGGIGVRTETYATARFK
jgi:hypothetical protein